VFFTKINFRNSASRWFLLKEYIAMHGPLNVKLITLYTTCFYIDVSFILSTDCIYVSFNSQKKGFFLSLTLSGWFAMQRISVRCDAESQLLNTLYFIFRLQRVNLKRAIVIFHLRHFVLETVFFFDGSSS
jgi:hypothetical protein